MRNKHPFEALLGVFLLSSCGGQTPRVATPAAPAVAVNPDPPAPAPAPTWGSLDSAGLASYVDEHARAKLVEVQHEVDPAALPAYIAHPDTAPELSGRAVERLMDLAVVALAQDRPADAEGIVRLVRARARNRNSAYVGTTLLSEARRRQAPEAGQRDAIETVFRELPAARFGAATVVFQLFQRREQLDARVAAAHEQMLSLETASGVLMYSSVMPRIVENRTAFLEAIDHVRAANAALPATPPYAFSTVDLARAHDAHDVVVGVWDLGVNPTLFERQLYTSSHDRQNGQDDDHDGLVDDVHGVVADGDAPQSALLYEPPADVLSHYSPFLQGVVDLRAGLASTAAAQRVLELMRGVTDVTELKALERNLDAVGEWAHGTHVAGILLAGNPHAKLAIFRSAWAGERRVYYDRGPTDAELTAERANMDAVARFIRAEHVRVVNASLGFEVEYLEDELRHEANLYHSDAEVHARALAVQQRRRENWQSVFDACPDTLFVVAAGNSNEDVIEYEDVPAAQVGQNLLTVGAVNRFGGWATFTNSSPDRVRIFGHGVEVDSLIPSGQHVALSGTSMASPNVANLAGKMFAVNPALTPARAVEIIVASGDPISSPFNGRIANEARAIAQARADRAGQAGSR